MKSLHDPFESLTVSMIDGLQHALYVLELAPENGRLDSNQDAISEVIQILIWFLLRVEEHVHRSNVRARDTCCRGD